MKIIFSIFLCFAAQPAFAIQTCPNIAGKYSVQTAGVLAYLIVLKQSGCERVQYFQSDDDVAQNFSLMTFILDGQPHYDSALQSTLQASWSGESLTYQQAEQPGIDGARQTIDSKITIHGNTGEWAFRVFVNGNLSDTYKATLNRIN